MTIGDVARQVGLPAKTIRYYEEIGLVRLARDANGYRLFGPDDLHRLGFLARARGLGFSIGECRALLALYEDGDRASADVKRIAEAHLARVEEKIAELHSLREVLSRLVADCAGDRRPDCPILADLADPPGPTGTDRH